MYSKYITFLDEKKSIIILNNNCQVWWWWKEQGLRCREDGSFNDKNKTKMQTKLPCRGKDL